MGYIQEVSFRLYTGTSQFTRPNDGGSVAYALYDIVGSNNGTLGVVGTFSALARANGQGGYITQARMLKYGTTGAGSCANFRVHYYAQPPAAIADNSPQTILWGTAGYRLFYIDFSLQSAGAGSDTAYDQVTEIYRKFWTVTRDIYYVVEARAAYLAPASEQYMLSLTAERY
jgi:hypothetical protein